MASLKDIKKKIKSVSNTRKITRTMEMVSAAKSKQTINRVEASTPYSEKLRELMEAEPLDSPGERIMALDKLVPAR